MMKNRLRNISTLARQYDKWANNRRLQPHYTSQEHTCVNCSTHFQGQFCPQCGLRASLSQLRFKSLFSNFMDMWGLGSRPIFRTMGQLFTRPGYMMRDYLTGHQPLYFPPFKMLMIICLIFITSAWLRNADLEHTFRLADALKDTKLSERGIQSLGYLDAIIQWFYDHLVFLVLLVQVVSVLATRIVFRKCSVRWTYIELFFSQVYMQCQYYLFEIVSIWLFGNTMDKSNGGNLLFLTVMLYQWLTYAQLYNLGFWRSLWLSVRKGILFVFLMFLLLVFILIFVYLL